MPTWTQNSATQAEVRVFILDNLYQSLPQPPITDDEIVQASDRVYNFIWARSATPGVGVGIIG